jgi:hypothetical protein
MPAVGFHTLRCTRFPHSTACTRYSAYPKEPSVACGQVPFNRFAIQNDDADQQTPGSSSRDMGSMGSVLVKDLNIPLHRQFEVQLFQNPNGATDNANDYPIRMVLSSYYFPIQVRARVPHCPSMLQCPSRHARVWRGVTRWGACCFRISPTAFLTARVTARYASELHRSRLHTHTHTPPRAARAPRTHKYPPPPLTHAHVHARTT